MLYVSTSLSVSAAVAGLTMLTFAQSHAVAFFATCLLSVIMPRLYGPQ